MKHLHLSLMNVDTRKNLAKKFEQKPCYHPNNEHSMISHS